jgi:putative holliday junction resolvase
LRIIALDIGEARTGVAVSDPDGRVATPLTVLATPEILADPAVLARIVEDYEARVLVVGLPLTLAGEEGPQARRVRSIAERLARGLRVDVEFFDERLSSAEAERVLASAGATGGERRAAVDKLAAAIVLQTYLDAGRAGADRAEGSDT